MQDLSLVSATENDIPVLTELAQRIWNQHYPSIISQTQIDYMLEKMYSASSLREQMRVKKHQFSFIVVNGKKIGFISVNEQGDNTWFLNKFYIDQQIAGKGLGTLAYQKLLDLIKPKKITLTVNRQNYKAINFYFKNGFVIEKVADFDIGEGYVMNDFVMTALNFEF
jgi:RimJ/RimL family protein N-acetyltransferase